MQKSADAFRTISEVADDLSLPQHVLRFWETRFPQIRPLKRAGGRRYYRPTDISLLRAIRQLLYEDGYTIKGVQRLLKEQGARDLGAGLRSESPADLVTDRSDLDGESLGEDLAPEDRPFETIAGVDDERRPAYSSGPARDLIVDALTTVEDCRRILDALLKSGRRDA